MAGVTEREQAKRPWITFRTPAEIHNYEPPEGHILVGDHHLVKGSVSAMGGAPGTGKSRASVALGQAGATQRDWFGYKVHRRFKTMIVQNENGSHRLKQELQDIKDDLDGHVLISEPPPFGLNFGNPEFRGQLSQEITQFEPDVLIIDPWNAVVRGQKQEDYMDAFEWIQSVVPQDNRKPAIVIVAHTRKPKTDETLFWSRPAKPVGRFLRTGICTQERLRSAVSIGRHRRQSCCLDLLQEQRWRDGAAFGVD
jgi:RecA-family ATPase